MPLNIDALLVNANWLKRPRPQVLEALVQDAPAPVAMIQERMLLTSRCPTDGALLKGAPHPAHIELWCRRCKSNVIPVGPVATEPVTKARVEVPAYIAANARRGLAWHADGLSGDGLVDKTVREARELAAGSVTEDKVVRMSAWFARHLTDLSAPQNKPDGKGYPGHGAVAWALWGGSPGSPRQAMDWAEARVAALDR